MSGSVNKVILVGNLGRDPEVRRLNSGEPVVSLRIATSENWRDKASGERRERTEWHDVVIYNENLARVAEQFLKKGSKVYLEGQLQTRKWQDQQSGQERQRRGRAPALSRRADAAGCAWRRRWRRLCRRRGRGPVRRLRALLADGAPARAGRLGRRRSHVGRAGRRHSLLRARSGSDHAAPANPVCWVSLSQAME